MKSLKTQSLIINFFVNGEDFSLISFKLFTLNDFLKFCNYKKNLILLEYNGKICNTKKSYDMIIKENDRIEIVTIVGGG